MFLCRRSSYPSRRSNIGSSSHKKYRTTPSTAVAMKTHKATPFQWLLRATVVLATFVMAVSASAGFGSSGSYASSASSFATTPTSTTTNFIDCNDPCHGGDVNYQLTASVRTMQMGFFNYTYRGRTFSKDGDPSHMGPTMFVQPGQSLWIKFSNELYDGDTHELSPGPVTADNYWKMVEKPGEKIKYQYYKNPVADPSLMEVDEANIPGNWDVTNLHLHGLDVEVHMFDPVGTHNPEAPHVAIHPGQCYCYQFKVPEHHPTGMYWYHPHLHGSSAVQLWGGMMGLLYVTPKEAEPESIVHPELAEKYGIDQAAEFVLWDPAFQNVREKNGVTTHDIEVDEFLLGQTTLSKIHPFLVNGQITPKLATLGVGQVLHLRALCATIENENTFIIYRQGEEDQDWHEVAIPLYVIGSDGVFYDRPVKRKVMVMAGGQREELLLQFDEPGTYVISQQGIQGMQFFDMYGHPHDQLLATIEVNKAAVEKATPVAVDDLMDIRLTPGYEDEETIKAHDIVKTETIVFSMGANRNMAPFPQYYINGKAFAPDRLDFHAEPGQAVEYILMNANHNVHPFHIHVNRFQVKEMGSELSTEKYPVLKEVLDFTPDSWRDTVVVPPNGRTRIWVQYKNYTGKTVLHCHFLAHEDTGMMATLFIGPPDYVFHWEDHWQLIVGLAVGAFVSISLLLAVSCFRSESERSVKEYYQYSVVAMNELKKKTFD